LVKKLLKGDGAWMTRKQVLGWLIDTLAMTIGLPVHRKECLNKILASIDPTQKRIATKQWHKILGELRSMSLAIPGSRGLFSTFQEAFDMSIPRKVASNLAGLHTIFSMTFAGLLKTLKATQSHPTHIAELVLQTEATIGACDACGIGMEGFAFVPLRYMTAQPIMWQAQFPLDIQHELVSFDNPMGKITNSDLELAGTNAQHDVLVQFADLREQTLHNLHDNTPAVSWQQKGSMTNTKVAAYLLRLQSLHQRFYRYVPIPGTCNKMADKCSRLWSLSDAELLTHLNLHYPQPLPWKLCPVRPPVLFTLISALSSSRSELALFLHEPVQLIAIGNAGPAFAPSWISNPVSRYYRVGDVSGSVVAACGVREFRAREPEP
jgi:hypothetical protein